MMSWRTITAGALVALAPATAVLAATAPCGPNVTLKPIFPLVMCVERTDTTSTNVGNFFPWTSIGFFFANYRNQYLYASNSVTKVAVRAVTIESMHSRTVSFTGNGRNNYTSTLAQFVHVRNTLKTALVKTFATNDTLGALHMDFPGNKVLIGNAGTNWGGGAALLSDWESRGPIATRNDLDTFYDFRVDDPTKTNILVDSLMRISTTGNAGGLVWDTPSGTGGCAGEGRRAYGSGAFVNPNQLTTAFGVDGYGFVWVFRGLAAPPPATIQMQIAEIVRLLVTPESLRCTWLDLHPDGKPQDDPISYPQGKDWDPISPNVSNGSPVTGEENGDSKGRAHGWQ